jgi:beta-glucuronidase
MVAPCLSFSARLIAVVMLMMSSISSAQPTPPGQPIAHPQGQGLHAPITSALDRVALSLNGQWNHIPDPFDNGSLTHLSQPLSHGYWEDQQRTSPEQRIEYNFQNAQPLNVPGDWNSQREDLFFYEGTLWYQRSFDFDASDSKRYFLHFGAVNRHADVWINGQYLGSHHVGFTPFNFEITNKLKPTNNTLVVRVDNRRRAEDVPAMRTDWWNYGGITRDVAILETPSTFIRAWEVQLSKDATKATGWIQLDGPNAHDQECKITIGSESPIKVNVKAGAHGIATFAIPWSNNLALWSPESPVLHQVNISTSSGDQAQDKIGFRTIATQGRNILLNNQPIFLRGICLHEEAPDREGRAYTEADARKLLSSAKELGCNYVRLAHYTHNEHMLKVADELGLMVWAEIPVYWVLDFENPVTRTYAQTHLTEMIDRDRNRASVIIWSVGNENQGSEIQTALRRDLAAVARASDPSRLISAACFVRMTRGDDGNLNGVFVDDPFGEYADILAINEYIGWYHDSTTQLAGLPLQTAWEKPLIFSEFGVGVKQGLHSDSVDSNGNANEIWTEEFGARFYKDQLAWCDELKAAGLLQGLSPWILKDFRSPRRPLAQIQDWYNRKGLISETGQKKQAFSVLQEQYLNWISKQD